VKNARPNLALTRPTTTRVMAGTSRAAAKIEEGEKRLVVNMPEPMHRALKLRAVERGVSMRDYVIGLLRADGVM
jgi:hypothetical protein